MDEIGALYPYQGNVIDNIHIEFVKIRGGLPKNLANFLKYEKSHATWKQHVEYLKRIETLAHSRMSILSLEYSCPEKDTSSVSVSSTSLRKFLSSDGEPWKLQ